MTFGFLCGNRQESSVILGTTVGKQASQSTRPWLVLLIVTVCSLLSLVCEVFAADEETLHPAEPSEIVSDRLLSFGVKGGLSFAQHYGTKERDPEYDVSSDWRESFAAGFFVYTPITRRFGLQNEILYARKGSRQDIGVKILDVPTVLDVTYDADYIEIPVLLKTIWPIGAGVQLQSLAGFAMSLKIHDRYRLRGDVDDGTQIVPLRADADMSEVDMFDYEFMYGLGLEFGLWERRVLLEHRFSIGWNTLLMPTYAYVPFEDDQLLIENEPVPLRNQNHLVLVGLRF